MGEPVAGDLAARIAADPRLTGFARVEVFAEVDSTNDLALEQAAAGAPSGTAVLADLQRAGRGRRGRTWWSPPGAGLYLSVVARPPRAVLSVVTLAAGTAAAIGVTTATGLPVALKWPNDLVVGSDWRKLGGVLCEAVTSSGVVSAVVIGVGINLRPAAYPPEVARRATSIEGELGRPASRDDLVIETMAALREALRPVADGNAAEVVAGWRRLAAAGTFGTGVRWQDRGIARRGRARGVDDEGALLVATESGTERLVAGEVTWEGRT